MSVHARITATAPALWNCVRSLTPPRAGRYAAGKVSAAGWTPHGLYSRDHSRVAVAKSMSAILPRRFSIEKFGLVPANTNGAATPVGPVWPEYGKYDVTGA